jgi:Galactose oxidase, central domain
MSTPRAVRTATRLPDGRILIAGGCTNSGCDLGSPDGATAEIFNPATMTFTPTGPLSVWRDDHAAVALPDGRVLFPGGLDNGTVVASAELYDPVTGTFHPTGEMSTARYKGGAVTLADGTVMVFGGSGDIDGTILYATSETYHPGTGTFSPGPAMHLPRYKLADSSVRLSNGDLLITGGAPQPEVFHAATGTFALVSGDLGATRLFLAAAALDGHRVLITGGYDKAIRPTAMAWLYDDRT